MDEILRDSVEYAGKAELVNPRSREIRNQLLSQKNELTLRMAKIDELLGLLDKNPDFEKFFNLARQLV